jgi:hypothetical protein
VISPGDSWTVVLRSKLGRGASRSASATTRLASPIRRASVASHGSDPGFVRSANAALTTGLWLRSEIKEWAKHTGRAQRGWFGAITTTIYVVYEGARAQGFYSAPIRTTFEALTVPKDVRS